LISNTQQLIDEFSLKATAAGLKIDCPADGMFHSQIAIVAEAPGEREAIAKSPLVGGSGSLLWTILRKNNIQRTDCYITNVSKRQVAFDTDDRRAPLSKHEFELWSELLRWELSNLPNVRLIIALGNYALQALTGNVGITQWRGSVIPVTLSSFDNQRPRTIQVVASFNPAAVLRNAKDQLVFHMDMARVRKVLDGRWATRDITVYINPSFRDATSFLAGLQGDDRPISYDIETMGGETACVGFANNDKEGMCINFRTATEHRYSIEEEMELRRGGTERLFGKSDRQSSLLKTICLILDGCGIKTRSRRIRHGSILCLHIIPLYPWMPHNLGFLFALSILRIRTTRMRVKSWKEEKQTNESIDQFWRYNVKDCCITWQAAHAMLEGVGDSGTQGLLLQPRHASTTPPSQDGSWGSEVR
jgi:uracil-DNA glycosylase family 4